MSVDKMNSNWRSPFLLSMAVIVVAFGGVGAWAATARLDGAVVAYGQLEVLGDRKVVQHREGGIVSEIAIQDDERVEAGQVLFRINPVQVDADVDILENQRYSLLAEEGRLLAALSGSEDINFEASIPYSYRIEQERIHGSVLAARENEVAILERQVDQFNNQIAAARSQIEINAQQIALTEEEQARVDPLVDRQLLVEGRSRELKQRHLDLMAQGASLEFEIERLQSAIEETNLRISQISRLSSEEISARLNEVRTSIQEINERISVAQDAALRSVIVAPASGRIVNLSVQTVGQVVAAGERLVEIVPDDVDLIVAARLSPLNVTHVHPGLTTEVRFPSFKQATTPVSFGEIMWVSADASADENTGKSFYELRASISSEGLPESIRNALVAGMPAELIVSTGERTVLEYLVQPLSDAMRIGMREE